jgi:hypothetical protein
VSLVALACILCDGATFAWVCVSHVTGMRTLGKEARPYRCYWPATRASTKPQPRAWTVVEMNRDWKHMFPFEGAPAGQ